MHQVSSSPVGGRNADSFSETRMVNKMLFHLAVIFNAMQCLRSDCIRKSGIVLLAGDEGVVVVGRMKPLFLTILHSTITTWSDTYETEYIRVLLRASFEGPFR